MGIYLENGKLVTYHNHHSINAVTGEYDEYDVAHYSERKLCLPHSDDICFLLPQYAAGECGEMCTKLIRDYAAKVQGVAKANNVSCPADLFVDLMEKPIQDMPFFLAEALTAVYTLFLMREPE